MNNKIRLSPAHPLHGTGMMMYQRNLGIPLSTGSLLPQSRRQEQSLLYETP